MSHNRDAAQLVDVVLDSRLSYHLRPHQREGVLFLYECVMGLRDFNGQGAILASVHTHTHTHTHTQTHTNTHTHTHAHTLIHLEALCVL